MTNSTRPAIPTAASLIPKKTPSAPVPPDTAMPPAPEPTDTTDSVVIPPPLPLGAGATGPATPLALEAPARALAQGLHGLAGATGGGGSLAGESAPSAPILGPAGQGHLSPLYDPSLAESITKTGQAIMQSDIAQRVLRSISTGTFGKLATGDTSGNPVDAIRAIVEASGQPYDLDSFIEAAKVYDADHSAANPNPAREATSYSDFANDVFTDETVSARHYEQDQPYCSDCGNTGQKDVYIDGDWQTVRCPHDPLHEYESIPHAVTIVPPAGDLAPGVYNARIANVDADEDGRVRAQVEIVDSTPFDCPHCEGAGFASDSHYCTCPVGQAKAREAVSESVAAFARYAEGLDGRNTQAAQSWDDIEQVQLNWEMEEEDEAAVAEPLPPDSKATEAVWLSHLFLADEQPYTIVRLGVYKLPWAWGDTHPADLPMHEFKLPKEYLENGQHRALADAALRAAVEQKDIRLFCIACLITVWGNRFDSVVHGKSGIAISSINEMQIYRDVDLGKLFNTAVNSGGNMNDMRRMLNLPSIFKYMPSDLFRAHEHMTMKIQQCFDVTTDIINAPEPRNTAGRPKSLPIAGRQPGETSLDYQRRYQREYQQLKRHGFVEQTFTAWMQANPSDSGGNTILTTNEDVAFSWDKAISVKITITR